MTRPNLSNLVGVIVNLIDSLRIENTSLQGQVRELGVENENLRMKIRALEIVQARPYSKSNLSGTFSWFWALIATFGINLARLVTVG